MRTVCGKFLVLVAGMAVADLSSAKDLVATNDFQSAIDAVAAAGGGTVRVPAGEYVTGGVQLKSGVTLELAEGARLVSNGDLKTYTHQRAMVYAENATNIALVGKGTVCGSGEKFLARDNAPNRPFNVLFRNCRDFRIEDVRLEASAAWTCSLRACERGVVRGIRIFSHANLNNDGLDIEASDLLVEDCDIDADDDALVFKSGDPRRVCRNVTVRNCRLASNCNAIKFGTESYGTWRDVAISNCTIRACGESRWRSWHEKKIPGGVPNVPHGLAGLAFEVVDGGVLENVAVRDITMEGMQTPIVVRLGARHEPPSDRATRLENILIENVTGTCVGRIALSVTGVLGGRRPNGITLRNVDLTMPGGATEAMNFRRRVAEAARGYPENRMFGHILPAWGLYLRHVDDVRLENVTLRLASDDARSDAVVVSDVTGISSVGCNFVPVVREDDLPPADCVDPFIGTEGTGHCFPNACVPFGMIQNGPSSGSFDWQYCSGYRFNDKKLYGFVHTALSGTGCADNGDILLQPFDGTPEDDAYRAVKGEETARPGYYGVVYPRSGNLRTEATCTARSAFWRFTYAAGARPRLLVDLQWGHTTRKDFAHRVQACEVTFPDSQTMCGRLRIKQWVERDLFFCMRFSRPVSPRKIAPRTKGLGDRYVLEFDFPEGAKKRSSLMVKVGLSANGLDAAKRNLDVEIPHDDFDAVAKAAAAKWNDFFSRMKVRGTAEQRRTFYTAMWHLALAPNDISDAGGSPFYSTSSFWDTFRAAHPLFTLIQPERVPDMVNSTLRHFDRNGFMPIWPFWGSDTQCMIGTHSVPVVVDAYLKGFGGVDWERVYRAIRKSLRTDVPGRRKGDFAELDRYGFYPYDRIKGESVSRLLECAYDDACAARLADGLGHADDAAFFRRRSMNWRNVFDASIGFVRGRRADGAWRTPFDPFRFGHGANTANDFTEGNAWQYTWHVMQDPYGLIAAFGGAAAFTRQLDQLFAASSDVKGDSIVLDISGLIGQYVHGNEPSHHVAYFYPFVGEPRKTAARVREICDAFYRNTPDGLSGNDDCGQMSAWYLFSAMGFYPFDPCGGAYVLGAPQVSEVELSLPGGKTFRIVAKNLSRDNKYVRAVFLNGRPLDGFILRHEDILRGGTLVFEMFAGDEQPKPAWADLKVEVTSSLDGSRQPGYLYVPPVAQRKKVPLFVVLHSWSFGYDLTRSPGEFGLSEGMKRGWAFYYPHFRGPNSRPEACGSDLAVQDIVDGIEYAKAHTNIDPDRIYLLGGSGGGHMALQMAGRHPEIWAGVVAACPISDVGRWHEETAAMTNGNARYARMLEKVCGGTPSTRPDEYRHRSPVTWLAAAKGVPLQIQTGIHDGHHGNSVPCGHAIRAFNCVAAEKDRVSDETIAFMERTETVPSSERFAGRDPFYPAPIREVYLRKQSGNAQLTVFNAGHAGNYEAGVWWLARQRRGCPADWSLPNPGTAASSAGSVEITR